MMALAHEKSCPDPVRPLHLFDSFEGLPEPGDVDGQEARRWIGKCAAPLTDCQMLIEREVCYPPALVHYHAGWFQHTLPAASTGPIALLRLDIVASILDARLWHEGAMETVRNLTKLRRYGRPGSGAGRAEMT